MLLIEIPIQLNYHARCNVNDDLIMHYKLFYNIYSSFMMAMGVITFVEYLDSVNFSL